MSAVFHHQKPFPNSGLRRLGRAAAGFIQGVILFGIALLAIVIAAFSSSNKSTTNSVEAEEAKTIASTIITQGGSIKTAVDRFRIDRGDLQNINFGESHPNGLFNTTDNFIRQLTIQPAGFSGGTAPAATVSSNQNGHYYLRKGSGTTVTVGGASVTHLLSATGLTLRTCQRINVNLHGSAFAGAPPAVEAGAVDDFKGTGTGTTTISNFTAGTTTVQNLEEGCVAITAGTGSSATTTYVYFKVLAR